MSMEASMSVPILGAEAGTKIGSGGVDFHLRGGFDSKSLRLDNQNWWRIGANALTIFIGAATFFMFTTLARSLYFFDPWVGTAACAASFVVAYVFMTLTTSAGVQPIFDFSNLILNSQILGMHATYTHKTRVNQDGSVHADVRRQGGQIGIIEAIVYLIALLAATFLGNGLARLIAGDGLYAHSAKIVPPWSTADRAFAIEWAVQSIVLLVGQQAVFYAASREWVAIFLGLAMLGFQAIGFGVSGASFNTIYWLGISVIGTGIVEDNFGFPVVWWDKNTWVYPVSTVVAIFTVILVGMVLGYLKKNAEDGSGSFKRKKDKRSV